MIRQQDAVPAALCLLLFLSAPVDAKIFGSTGSVADDDRVELDWPNENTAMPSGRSNASIHLPED